MSLLPVGRSPAGPTPQMIPRQGLAGERKRLWTVSPVPKISPEPTAAFSDQLRGRIVREIRFQSGPSEIGMTGWILSVARLPVSSVFSFWS